MSLVVADYGIHIVVLVGISIQYQSSIEIDQRLQLNHLI